MWLSLVFDLLQGHGMWVDLGGTLSLLPAFLIKSRPPLVTALGHLLYPHLYHTPCMECTVYTLTPFVSTAHSHLLQPISLTLLCHYERRITKHYITPENALWGRPSPFKNFKLCVYSISCVFFSKALCPWFVCLLQQRLHCRSFNLSL